MATGRWLLTLAPVTLLALGCATKNVNPSQARAHTGYVDFRADPLDELYWDVSRFEDRSQSYRRVFSDLRPPPTAVLRLAFAPGSHRLRITFLNRVILVPAEITVEVQDGQITPVRVQLADVGATSVETREVTLGGTARGHLGRRTKLGTNEAIKYELSAVAESPVAYQRREPPAKAR